MGLELANWETMAAALAEGDMLAVTKMEAPLGTATLGADRVSAAAAAVVGSKDCALESVMHQNSPRTPGEGPAGFRSVFLR